MTKTVQRDKLIDAVQRGGTVEIVVYNQKNGPYCSVMGLGVNAGGYATVDDAIAAWNEAREHLPERGV